MLVRLYTTPAADRQKAKCLLLFKQIMVGLCLPVLYNIFAAVDFVQQFVQTSSVKHVMLNSA